MLSHETQARIPRGLRIRTALFGRQHVDFDPEAVRSVFSKAARSKLHRTSELWQSWKVMSVRQMLSLERLKCEHGVRNGVSKNNSFKI